MKQHHYQRHVHENMTWEFFQVFSSGKDYTKLAKERKNKTKQNKKTKQKYTHKTNVSLSFTRLFFQYFHGTMCPQNFYRK